MNNDDNDRYPFIPVDCGRPIDAALFVVAVVGLIAAACLVMV